MQRQDIVPSDQPDGREDRRSTLAPLATCTELPSHDHFAQLAASLEAQIAERKHAESVAHAEQTKLRMAVAVAQLGVWELDGVTNAFSCSDQCKVHFGLRPEEPLTYERFFELVHPEDRFSVQKAFQRLVS